MKNRKIIFYILLSLAILLILIAIFAPLLSPYDAEHVELSNKLMMSSKKHLLGTDHMGRDILSRLIYGTRLSLSISSAIIFLNLIIGLPIGLAVGWYGGKAEACFTWLTNIIMSFPTFLLSLSFAGILGQGIGNIIIAVSSVGWVYYARIVRNMVFTVKETEYVLFAKTMGASSLYILKTHVLPFVIKPVLIVALMNIGEIVLMISGFSFLGIGVQPNVAEWGMMLNDAKAYFRSIPGMTIYPGVAILITVLTFNLLGEYFEKKENIRI
ncbi:ABC transporter permease [Eubacteriales bacterium KG127]